MKKVMVFGTFDGVHAGHRAFLKEARTYGDYLITVIAQDEIVEQLKGRKPVRNISARVSELQNEDGVNEVVIGDAELGTWDIVKKHRPDVIAAGYDQHSLKENLEARLEEFDWRPVVVSMHAFEPDKNHSSLQNK